MRKLLMALAAVLSSVWFAPVTFFAGVQLGMEAICLQQHCRRTYGPQDVPAFNCTASDPRTCKDFFYDRRPNNPESPNTPPRWLAVAVALPLEGRRVTVIDLDDWPAMKIKSPSASLMLPMMEGSFENGSRFSVLSSTPTSQIVSVHSYHDDPMSEFKYETDGTTIRPMSSKVMSVGYMFISLPFALFLAWAVQHIAMRWRRRLKAAPV